MQRLLPPLTSLKTFEAAARHLSFTNAATELCVTQAAISHQIKAIEEYLGAALFIRHPRRLELTATGEKLLPVVRESLDAISRTVADIRNEREFSPLCIAVAPSFAVHWLMPRLEELFEKHPGIELSLKHWNGMVDFTKESFDIAISYGPNQWRGLQSQAVLNIDFFPVCAPELLQGKHKLETVDDLQHFNLLHDADHQTWAKWLQLAGANQVDPNRGTIVDDTNVLIKAARDGLGVAMCSMPFVKELLATGKLVQPFELSLSSDKAYYAVCPKEHLSRKEVSTFWSWLTEQSRRQEESL
ncbi:MAG: transcriptional regulator GcvA [Pseudomonadota bacterium]